VPNGIAAAPPVCAACGTDIAQGLLSCPACKRLVHSEELKRLAETAEAAERAGDHAAATAAWQEALALLPADSAQHAAVAERASASAQAAEAAGMGARPAAAPAGSAKGGALRKGGAMAAAAALLLWKLKFVVVFVLTKGKLLLLGLTKTSTLFSMLASFGVYWTAWGWRFAAGLIASIYVHEMGHVAALRRYGIRASAPMFIPGLGAVVRMHQAPQDAARDARVGLAGPLWGLCAALAAYAVYFATKSAIWGAIAHTGAWINLFNLLPVWQLDGGRGFRALTRPHRWLAAAAIAAAWLVTAEGLFLLLLVAAAAQAFARPAEKADRGALWLYLFLIAAFAALVTVPVPRGV
jgi:Zn-dependent protease